MDSFVGPTRKMKQWLKFLVHIFWKELLLVSDFFIRALRSFSLKICEQIKNKASPGKNEIITVRIRAKL